MYEELEAEPFDACKMFKTAMWMIENYKFDPQPREPFIFLHPDELRRIEKEYGSVDNWYKENTGGRQTNRNSGTVNVGV